MPLTRGAARRGGRAFWNAPPHGAELDGGCAALPPISSSSSEPATTPGPAAAMRSKPRGVAVAASPFTLAVALSALPCASAAAAALYTPTLTPSNLSSTSAIGWPSSSARTSAVAAAITNSFGVNPSSTVFTCALIDIGVSYLGQLREPFAGYAFPMGSVLADTVASLPYGSVTRVALTDLDGLLVRTLLELQATVGFGLEFIVAKPPLTLIPVPVGSGSGTDAFVQWAFHTLNASCVLWPSPASPTRRLYFRQTVPLMTFGYRAVTTRPKYKLPSALDRVFMWTKPFSPGVWCLLMTAIVVYAIGMPLFEGRDSSDFGPWWDNPSTLVGHSLYLGAMGPSKPDTYEPTSGAGRAASALNAFALLLIVSTYTANQLTTMDPAMQVVSDILSFNPRVSACARSSNTLMTLLNSSYPNAAAALSANNTFSTSTSGSQDALRAVLAGHCEGAILPQTEAAWIMGVNDTRGEFCELQAVGATEGTESMPLTFSKASMTNAQLESLNMAIEELQRAGDFILDLEDSLFPSGPRSICAPQDSRDSASAAALLPGGRVEVIDLAGAFLLQAIGFSMGALIHCCKLGRKRATAWRALKRGDVASGGVEAPAAAPEEEAVTDFGRELKRHEALGVQALHDAT